MIRLFLLAISICTATQLYANIPYVEKLMSKMTIDEKIGQLNLMPAGNIVTGEKIESKTADDIASGRLGGIFNIKGREKIEKLQKLAVEKSRLGIPLIVGMDIIHGYDCSESCTVSCNAC